MKVSWRTELPSWLLMAGMWILAGLSWAWAPDRIPVHWGWNGQPDRFGGKAEGLLLMPAMTLGIYVLMLVLPRIDPGRANYRSFAGAYTVARLVMVTAFALIYGVTQLYIRNQALDTSTAVMSIVGGLLLVLGSLMGKLRPNWFIGVRTPWTLSSKLSWVRTHRLGGWLFTGLGLALILAALIHTAWALTAVMALFVVAVVWLTVYSYLVWRADPDKVSPAGTLPAE